MSMDRRHVAAVRKLISDSDGDVVHEGLLLLAALGDTALWELVVKEVDERVKAAHRRKVWLHAMQGAGLHQPSDELEVTIEQLPLLAGTAIGHVKVTVDTPGSLEPLRTCGALRTLSLKWDNSFVRESAGEVRHASDLKNCDALAGLPLERVEIGTAAGYASILGADTVLLSVLGRIPTLQSLCLVGCDLEDLSALSDAASLTTLRIRGGFLRPQALTSMARLGALQELEVGEDDDLGAVKADGLSLDALASWSELPFSWKDAIVTLTYDGVFHPLAHEAAQLRVPVVEVVNRILRQQGLRLSTGADAGDERVVYTVSGVEIPMMRLPPGVFLMGSPASDREADSDEYPQHLVRLTRGFELGVTPVTNAQWEAVMGESRGKWKDPHRPVTSVTTADAELFCARLGEALAEQGFRLPTEAEWEYACRAGYADPRYGDLDDIAWHKGNSGGCTQEVGRKQPNAWGLNDMLGNVSEWTSDTAYREYTNASPSEPLEDPTHAGGSFRVLRGGWYCGPARSARAASRRWNSPDRRFIDVGFRLARTAP